MNVLIQLDGRIESTISLVRIMSIGDGVSIELSLHHYKNNRVVSIAPNSTTAIRVIGDRSQSNMFTFNGPSDVFVTRTSIYVMDTGNFRVQKWSRNFSNPVTVAGISRKHGSATGMNKISNAFNLFVDNYGNLFVSDYVSMELNKRHQWDRCGWNRCRWIRI